MRGCGAAPASAGAALFATSAWKSHGPQIVEELRHSQRTRGAGCFVEEASGAIPVAHVSTGQECTSEVVPAPSGPACGPYALVHVERRLMVIHGCADMTNRQREKTEIPADRAQVGAWSDDHALAVAKLVV